MEDEIESPHPRYWIGLQSPEHPMQNPQLMLRAPLRKKPSREPGFQRLPVGQGETQEIR